MKFSENWLRTFANPPLSSAALSDALTMSGLEVETVESAAPDFDGVVIAEVLEVQKHPDADRLSVCRVNTGADALQVVCGAPNVRAGIRVPLAQVGATLPGIQIKQAKVRGVVSSGMLCSGKELGISEAAAGLLILPADAPIGADIRAYLDLDDKLFTVKPTPNRGDCLSVFGIAREVAAVTSCALAPLQIAVSQHIADDIDIAVEEKKACPRYCGRVVRGVDARAATPEWMARRLERSGLRSISAVVDITNYVLLELGQPLHAFDHAKIDGGIRVRFAHAGEHIRLLNERELALDASLLVIADYQKPLALAGIMGGADSAVKLDTRDILLESAFFDPAVISGKSRQLGFGSDSSYRFERGVDYAATGRALDRATQLVLEICGGKAGPACEVVGELPARVPVKLTRDRAQRLLGIELSEAQIDGVFRRLNYGLEGRDGSHAVTPPSYRFDLTIEQDMIEEIARIYGYDNIPAAQPQGGASMLPAGEAGSSANAARMAMVLRDYQEIITYSFVDREWETDFCDNREPVALVNPIAAQFSVMRSSLIGSLVECLKVNLSRQQERIRLFELGRCFRHGANGYDQTMMLGGIAYGEAVAEQWGVPRRRVDFYDTKSDVEALLAPAAAVFEAARHPALHPGRAARLHLNGEHIGWTGELHPQLCGKYNLPFAPMVFEINLKVLISHDPVRYREFSRQPLIRRDIAVEVGQQVSVQAMLEALKKGAPSIVLDVALFDVYRGKGIDSDKKSVAFRVLLQDTVKTLTDTDAEAAQQLLLKVLQEKFQARLRK